MAAARTTGSVPWGLRCRVVVDKRIVPLPWLLLPAKTQGAKMGTYNPAKDTACPTEREKAKTSTSGHQHDLERKKAWLPWLFLS